MSAPGAPPGRAGPARKPPGTTPDDALEKPPRPPDVREAPITADPWTALRAHTAARIALGRSGASLPTAEWLRFGLAHAQARDAVHTPFDAALLSAELSAHGFATIELESAADTRATYLHRPDLGRRLSLRSRALLAGDSGCAGCKVLCVVADGLSATAVHRHALALLLELRARLEAVAPFAGAANGIDAAARDAPRLGPVVLAHQARVALGDEIGAALRAGVVVMLLGERPGLSSPDSLGAYLTLAPRVGCTDAQRNCVSNIRPEGLAIADAADKIAWLIDAALRLGASGVALKDDSAPAHRLEAPHDRIVR